MKCAEVICESLDDFSIVCLYCKLKILDFSQFLQHFINVHQKENQKDGWRLLRHPSVRIMCEMEVTTTSHGPAENRQQYVHGKGERSKNIPTGGEDQIKMNRHLKRKWRTTCEREASDATMKTTFDQEEPNFIPNKNIKVEPTTEIENDTTTEMTSTNEAELNINSPTQMTQTESSTDTINITGETKSEKFKCIICNKYSKTKYAFDRHMLQIHRKLPCGSNFQYKCQFCTEIYDESELLHAHALNAQHGSACDKCTKVCRSEEALLQHSSVHIIMWLCDAENCGLKFSTKKRLNRHRKFKHQIPFQPYRPLSVQDDDDDDHSASASVDQMSSANHSHLSSVQATDTATLLGDILSNQQILLERLMSVDSGIKGLNNDMQSLIKKYSTQTLGLDDVNETGQVPESNA